MSSENSINEKTRVRALVSFRRRDLENGGTNPKRF